MKMNKIILSILICSFLLSTAYAWTDYTNVRYMDLDGDLENEIIVESRHGAGSNHYIEDMRIFKDTYPKLELIFSIRTLDSYSGFLPSMAEYNYDIVSEVEFTEQTPENKGIREIIVKSKKIYYKSNTEWQLRNNDENIDKVEDLGTKIYRWNGRMFQSGILTAKEFLSMNHEELSEWLKDVEDVNIDWEYLKTCNMDFWETGDLDNDGKEEGIGIFSDWGGWWVGDIGYVICIFDQDHNILYGEEAVRYADVTGLSIEDSDGDGLKETIVSYKYIESWPDDTGQSIYGWDGKKFVKEKVITKKK